MSTEWIKKGELRQLKTKAHTSKSSIDFCRYTSNISSSRIPSKSCILNGKELGGKRLTVYDLLRDFLTPDKFEPVQMFQGPSQDNSYFP